jgi:hypothetical protein
MAGLEPSALAQLRERLIERFGPDPDHENNTAAAHNARTRGRIRSEREYRAVQAYADSIAADVGSRDDFDALGALLDEYASRPATYRTLKLTWNHRNCAGNRRALLLDFLAAMALGSNTHYLRWTR